MELVSIETGLNGVSNIINLENQQELNNKNFYFSQIIGNHTLQLNLDRDKIKNNIHFDCLFNKGINVNNITISGVFFPLYLLPETITETETITENFRKQTFVITTDNNNINIFSYITIFYKKKIEQIFY